METKLTEIQQRLMEGQILPQGAVQDLAVVVGYYSFYSEQLEAILLRKPKTWLFLRKDQKSDKATDRAYELTDDGINEMGLSMRMKRMEKQMSVLRAIINTANVQYVHAGN